LDTPPLGSTAANVNEMVSYQESSGAVSKPCSGKPSLVTLCQLACFIV